MRAVFILLICIATKHPEGNGMGNRIDKIEFLVDEEKKSLKKLWRRLNGWSHPYGKWAKEICPIFVAHKPLYHSKIFDTCLRELTELVDFFLTITTSKYEVSTESLQHLKAELNESLSEFKLLASRI